MGDLEKGKLEFSSWALHADGVSSANPPDRMLTMEKLMKQFRYAAGTGGCITFQQFRKLTDHRSELFANSIFQAIDKDRNEHITCDEYVSFMFNLECQDLKGRLKVMFEIFDVNNSGGLSLDQLSEILKESIHESNASMDTDLVAHLAQVIMDLFDANKDGRISLEEFTAATARYPELLKGLTIGGFGITDPKMTISTWIYEGMMQAVRTICNNRQRTTMYFVLLTLLIFTFYWRVSQYLTGRKTDLMGYTLPIAKGCGQMMKVVFALILFPVSRTTLTRLRMTFLRHIFPFDDAIGLHKLLGSLGFVFAVIHSLCHVVDVWRWGDPGRRELFFLAFPDETRQPTHFELLRSQVAITGMGMLSIYSIVFLTASNWPRRSPWLQETRLGAFLNNFNLIWYVHHLTAVFFLLLMLHPMPHIPNEKKEWGYSDTWAWIGIPTAIYLLERLARIYRQTKDVHILAAKVLPGRVLALKLSKPKSFKYRSGNYAFINVPSISQFEWHPFSLTSAPGADHLSMHIKVCGDWTEELFNRFKDYEYVKSGLDLSARTKQIIPLLELSQGSTQANQTNQVDILESMSSYCTCRSGLDRSGCLGSSPVPNSGILDALCQVNCNDGHKLEKANSVNPTNTCNKDWPSDIELRCSMRRAQTVVTEENKASNGKPHQCASLADIIAELKVRHSPGATIATSQKPNSEPKGCTSENKVAKSEPSVPAVSPFQALTSKAFNIPDSPREQPTKHSFTVDLAHIEHSRDLDELSTLPLKLKLDGPFGAPVQSFKDYEVIMLVGAGIGVTPFASILSDVLQRMTSRPGKRSSLPGLRKLKKVYFHWSVKSQSEVMWFQRVLEAISQDDAFNRLEINVHITGLRTGQDIRTMMFKVGSVTPQLEQVAARFKA